MNRNKVLGLLGLAEKAGKVRSGEFSTEKAVKSGKAGLVIVSEESSDNTKKMFRNMCTYYKVPYFEFGSKGRARTHPGKADESVPGRDRREFFQCVVEAFYCKSVVLRT